MVCRLHQPGMKDRDREGIYKSFRRENNFSTSRIQGKPLKPLGQEFLDSKCNSKLYLVTGSFCSTVKTGTNMTRS